MKDPQRQTQTRVNRCTRMSLNARSGSHHVISHELAAARRTLPLGDCRPGMRLAEALYTPQGTVMLQEKKVLTDSLLQRLAQLGYKQLRVQLTEAEAREAAAQYEQRYQQCLTRMDGMFSEAAQGRYLAADSVHAAAETVMENAAEGSDAYLQKEATHLPDVSAQLRVHSLNTAMLAIFLHQWMKKEEALLPVTVQGALLHDIGKARLDPLLLEISGPMTPKEETAWKRHPREGWQVAHQCRGLHPLVGTLVAMHHEQLDGSGYPMGLSQPNIHPLARVIAVADRFDNLTTGTPREKSVSPFQAVDRMEREAEQGFHPEEVDCMLCHICEHYVGERFFLSNGEIGQVMHINAHAKSRPLMRTAHGFLDLSRETNVTMGAMV